MHQISSRWKVKQLKRKSFPRLSAQERTPGKDTFCPKTFQLRKTRNQWNALEARRSAVWPKGGGGESREKQLKDLDSLPKPKEKTAVTGPLGYPHRVRPSPAQASGGLTSLRMSRFSPQTALNVPTQVWLRVAESNSVLSCALAAATPPGTARPQAPDRPPSPDAAPPGVRPRGAGVGDERVTSSFPAAARARATRSHTRPDWSGDPGPGRPTRAPLSGSRRPPPSSLPAPPRSPGDPRSRPGRLAGSPLGQSAPRRGLGLRGGWGTRGCAQPAPRASLFPAAAPGPRAEPARPAPRAPAAAPGPSARAAAAGLPLPARSPSPRSREVPGRSRRPGSAAWPRLRRGARRGASRLRAEPGSRQRVAADSRGAAA